MFRDMLFVYWIMNSAGRLSRNVIDGFAETSNNGHEQHAAIVKLRALSLLPLRALS
jgi:hypothetical protein